MKLTVLVKHEDHSRRAVDVLVRQAGMSRLGVKRIRLYGSLTCNGLPHRMIDPVHEGDVLVVDDLADRTADQALRPVPGVQVCFLDPWLAVLGKPPGLVTHPSYLHEKRSLTSLLSDKPLHPVSRLDRDTSGAVLIAMNGHAHHVLTGHPMQKTYLGLIRGRFTAPAGLIQAPIRRSERSIMLREVHPSGAPAKTLWQELHYFTNTDVSLVRFELLTGRTHQIRLHCLAAGHPLVGETLYARRRPETEPDTPFAIDGLIGRQALHAAMISFRHPISGHHMKVSARLPDDFRTLLRTLYRMEHPTA